VITLALAAVLAAGGASAWLLSHDDTARAAPKVKAAEPSTTTTTAAPTPGPVTVATTKVPQLVAYHDPDTSSPAVAKLSAVTDYGLPRTLLVTQQQGDWLQTLLPIQPNDTAGWVKASDVTLSQVTTRIVVSLSSRYLALYDGATKIVDTGVGIGKDETPTPLGTFYVTDPLDLTAKPNGAYGAFAIGLSGFSDVLKSFEGGPPQIAVHGDTVAADVGQKVSNGCIRVPNAVIVQIAQHAPLGTPVIIVA